MSNYKNVYLTRKELEEWNLLHRCLGDAVDNIPNIKSRTAFSPTFLSYLKENEIYTEKVQDFLNLSISAKIMEDYTVYKKITAGKKKGQYNEIFNGYMVHYDDGTQEKITKMEAISKGLV